MVSVFLGVPWGEPILKNLRPMGSREVFEELEKACEIDNTRIFELNNYWIYSFFSFEFLDCSCI